jgi:predicted DNA-binding protein with PD1-like motif
MQSAQKNNLIIARLFPGEDLFQLLGEIGKKYDITTAVVISAIGQIKQFRLGYFNGEKYDYRDYGKTHELLSISGLISKDESPNGYKFHMHAVVGDEEQNAFGGHLFKGTVEGTNEIVLLKTGIKTQRKKDENTGLQGLSFG